MNPSFDLVLKSERCIDISKTDNYLFLVKHDTKIVKVKAKRGIPVTKFKSQIILMKKNGLNVEHFRYLITINYDKKKKNLHLSAAGRLVVTLRKKGRRARVNMLSRGPRIHSGAPAHEHVLFLILNNI